MCGIAGIWNRGGEKSVDQETLLSMGETLQHRGPDDHDAFCKGVVGLVHQRLSIIDLSVAGRQPMSTRDGRYTLVFNGEIYNYQELREEHFATFDWRGESDSEVLLELLVRHGVEALAMLKGMFALAFWDAEEEVLLLARDPFGKKPLYFWSGEQFVFGSEAKAVLTGMTSPEKVDRVAQVQYFLHEYVPGKRSGWEGIGKLLGGEAALVSRDTVDIQTWWKPDFTPVYTDSFSKAAGEFDELLAQAVRRRMIADVPIGLLLSGGLDSSAIGWYMKQQSNTLLHSFSVSFDEASYDEGRHALFMAEELGFAHHDRKFDLDQFKDSVERLVPLMDVPFSDASLLPTSVLCKLARENVTVVLDGDGSDELLFGYGTYQAAVVADQLSLMPKQWWGGLRGMARFLPTSLEYFTFDFKVKQFLKGLSYSPSQRQQVWLGSFDERELGNLLTDTWRLALGQLFEEVDSEAGRLHGAAPENVLTGLMIKHYLQDGILFKLDRAAMFEGLEARTPFLDVDLADFVLRLPVEMRRDKRILKHVMRGRLPDTIIDRKKHGFAMPIGKWLQEPLNSWVRDVLSEEKIREDAVLRWSSVARLLDEHQRGSADHRKKLWTLTMWQLWYDYWVVGRR